MAQITVVLLSGTSWTDPGNTNGGLLDSVECFGDGGGGAGASNANQPAGGGGGQYAYGADITVTFPVAYGIGIGGVGGGHAAAGASGTGTFFGGTSLSSCLVGAGPGGGASATGTPGAAGSGTYGSDTSTRNNGGAGGTDPNTGSSGSGGGGAGGPTGAGANGGTAGADTAGGTGGGAADGGSAGATHTTNGQGSAGGNNNAATGGGAGGTPSSINGGAGTLGGGGGGGFGGVTHGSATGGAGGAGGNEAIYTATSSGLQYGPGAGGGGGGGGSTTDGAGGDGGYGGGGGGAGGWVGTDAVSGGHGGQGFIVVKYTPPVVGPLTITTTSPLPSATIGIAYSTTIAAEGGTPPYSWSITANSPDTGSWSSINSSSGVLSGTPGTVETESITIQVTDSASGLASTPFTLEVNAGPWASNVYQHVGGGGNPYPRGNAGNAYKIPLPEISGAGNCYVLAFTNDGGATVSSVSGAINGSFGSPAVTALAGSGSLDSRMYILPNITAGSAPEVITVTFSANVDCFQYTITEYYGIETSSPGAGSSSVTLSPTIGAGSFTPTNNNATGGNLIAAYFCKSDQAPNNPTNSLLQGGGFTFLNANIGWLTTWLIPNAAEVIIQSTAAAINPAMTSVGEASGDNWNSLAVALKLQNGAGTPPPSAIRVNKIDHFSTIEFPTSGNYNLQCPAFGNLRILVCCDMNLHAQTITDSDGNTWASAGANTGIWYCLNTLPNASLVVTAAGGGTTNILSWRFLDVYGPGAWSFDSGVASDQAINSQITFTASPTISPATAAGFALAALGLTTGPGLTVTSPAGAAWDLCTYTSETDQDLIENADIMAHYAYSASGSQTWTFGITSKNPNQTSGGLAAFSLGGGGGAALTARGDSQTSATADLTGGGALNANGAAVSVALAQPKGSGTLTTLGIAPSAGIATLSGSNPGAFGFLAVSMTANAEQGTPITDYVNAPGVSASVATVQATGALPAGLLAITESAAFAQLSGTEKMAALAAMASRASVSLTGAGAMSASGVTSTGATAPLAGPGATGARGDSATTGPASLAGAGALSAQGISASLAVNMLGGAMPLSVHGASMTAGPGNLSASFALSALGVSGTDGRMALAGAGAITARATSATTGLIQPQGLTPISLRGVSATTGLTGIIGASVGQLSTLAVSMSMGCLPGSALYITPFGFALFSVVPLRPLYDPHAPPGMAVCGNGAACIVSTSLFTSVNVAFEPSALAYRVDDLATGANLVPWTSLPANATTQVEVQNTMVSNSRRAEIHQALYQITDAKGNTFYARALWEVLRVE